MKHHNQSMTRKNIFLLLLLSLFILASCKKEKESRTIITTIEEPHFTKTPKTVGDTIIHKSFEWGSTVYHASIERKADKEVVVRDDDGQKYYDNKVTLKISGSDGEFFNKTFTKDSFTSYINTDYVKPKRSVLIGVAFNRVEKGGNAIFVATVGSPDSQSDEFMSVQINIDKQGAMTMGKLQEIQEDMGNADLFEE